MLCPWQHVYATVLFLLQIYTTAGQLANFAYSSDDMLDYYEPSQNSGNITRIVGGKAVNIRRVPWQVALYSDGGFICGGSIISTLWVVTAAHCADFGHRYTLTAGSNYAIHRGQFRYTSLVIVNSGFQNDPMNNDIALIKVRKPFRWTYNVKPVKLAKPRGETPNRFFISGWGTTAEDGFLSPVLRGATLKLFPRKECQRRYSRFGLASKYMICAKAPGKDACQGDSGGPLVYKNVLYGIVSVGIGCARPKYPGIYTNVRRQYLWIRKVIRRHGGPMPSFD